MTEKTHYRKAFHSPSTKREVIAASLYKFALNEAQEQELASC